MKGDFFDRSGESPEFPLKPGTPGTDGREGDREHDKGEEVPARMLDPAYAMVPDPVEIAAAIKMLSEVRKRLGQARAAIGKVPVDMMTDLARGEATQEIVVACAWVEEAREVLKHPLSEQVEDVPTSTWED